VPDALPADVPDRVRDLVSRMLAKDPEERFADGAALLSAVEDVLAAPPALPSPDQCATTVLRPTDRPPAPDVLPGVSTTASRRSRHAAPGGRPRTWLLIPLVAVVALIAVLTAVLAGTERASAPSAGATPEQTTAPAVHVAAEAYLGRPVREVEAELTRLGMSVQLRELRTARAPDGAVLAVGPTGELSPGQAVTVTHAVPVPTPSPVEEQGEVAATAGAEAGGTDGGTEGSASQTATAPEPSARPGNSGRASPPGRANGRGNG
jgi:hypothetical protein